jgi:sulfide dehydrogenase [flavocytochrome c] flavoprotein chain
MIPLSRRRFVKLAGAGAAFSTLAAPSITRAARARVVVIGGGAGGATAAKYIAMGAKGTIDVVLIDAAKTYHTCFFSNLYLGGLRDYASLTHTYDTLTSAHPVRFVHDRADAIDRDRKVVRLRSGSRLPYDRLILSPGIDLIYGSVPGYSAAVSVKVPHAWKSGPQLQLLKAQVMAMRPGGTFVMVPPPDPSRCPPAPYERVSMIAHLFRQHNPSAKIVILDPKEKFPEQALFQTGWESYYPGMIQWLPPSITGGLMKTDFGRLRFTVDLDTFEADAASVVPAQRAGGIARQAGLTDTTGWCPILPETMQSAVDNNIHVIGDAAIASAMPKSASAANSQAKVAALAVRHALTGAEATPARYTNTCWSLIAPNDGIKVGATYKAGDKRIEPVTRFLSKNGESAALRKKTYEESVGWYDHITRDIFG